MADTYVTGGGNTAVLDPDRAPDGPRRLLREMDAEYEFGHGMEPLADLHAERELIAGRYAELRPLHGPAKMWEHQRKALRSLIEMELRHDWGQTPATEGVKLTESAVDAAAHTDPRYTRFLDDGIATATEYEQLAVRMGNLEERASRGQVVGRLRASEMHMTPSGA